MTTCSWTPPPGWTPVSGWRRSLPTASCWSRGRAPPPCRDASRVGDLLELMGKKNIRLIVNRVDKSMLGTVCLTIDDVMDAAGLPLAGIVPEDPHVTLAASFGQSLLRYSPNCKAAKASRRIARRIQGFHEPIALR